MAIPRAVVEGYNLSGRARTGRGHTRGRRGRIDSLFRGHLRAYPLLLGAELGRELGTEILRFEHLANLDLGLRAREGIGAALDPFDRFFLGLHLPQPEAGDQLLRLGEGSVDDRSLCAREPDARAFRARLEPLAR